MKEGLLYRSLVTLTGGISLAVFIWASVTSFLLAILLQALALPWDPHRRTSLRVQHLLWGRLLFWLMPSGAMIRETRDLPGEGPYIVVSNHASMLDIPACMGLPLPLRVVGKPGLFKVPVLGRILRFYGHIEVPWGGEPEQVDAFLDHCKQSLAQGLSLLIFPEGTRTRDGRIQSFHRGAFRLAKDTGVPVLPVVIRGTWYAYPRGYFIPRCLYQRMYIDVLPPIDPSERKTARALSNEVRRRMVAYLDEHAIPPDFPVPTPKHLAVS